MVFRDFGLCGVCLAHYPVTDLPVGQPTKFDFLIHLSRSTTEHLIEKNVHSLIICDAIFVTVRHERRLPSFSTDKSNLISPKAPFNEAVASSYT
jgi:hypothetical protein